MKIDEILNNVKELYKDKFNCIEDYEDFMQDVVEQYLNKNNSRLQPSQFMQCVKRLYEKTKRNLELMHREKYSHTNLDYVHEDELYEAANSTLINYALCKNPLYDGKTKTLLETLTPREARVLKLRYGIEDGIERTLDEVGCEFKVTSERIRQIEAKALRKLRHPSRSKLLRRYTFEIGITRYELEQRQYKLQYFWHRLNEHANKAFYKIAPKYRDESDGKIDYRKAHLILNKCIDLEYDNINRIYDLNQVDISQSIKRCLHNFRLELDLLFDRL